MAGGTDRGTIKELRQRVAALEGELAKALRELERYRKLYELSREQIALLKRGLIGRRAERFEGDQRQLSLALLGMMLGGKAERPGEPRKVAVPAHERRKPVRRPLPEHLPRVRIELVPEEVERKGLDAFVEIGQERRETLERRPPSLVVVEVVRRKFVRRSEQGAAGAEVLVAPPAELPIERGQAGPGLLADTVVRRWQDHLPLCRQEAIYRREGIELARSTLAGWHEALAELAGPVVEAMWADARGQPYLCVDATGVLVQAPKRCRRGHFWVLVAPGRHVLFAFSERHDAQAVDRLLGDYRGYLVADAHAVYDHLYRSGRVVEVGCWAHARRYFFEALPSEPERARWALERIGWLFAVERSVADRSLAQRRQARRQHSAPIVEAFFAWCEQQREELLDGAPISAAVRYALNQKKALERFLDDPRLPLDNNISERHLRRQAVGRKNWLFVGSKDGARANCVFVSLLASCQMHGIEPWSYLRDLFCLLPRWPVRRAVELAPVCWPQTIQRPEVQERLAANIYRRACLDSPPAAAPQPHRATA